MNYKFGQHLEVSRGIYNHHGICIGENKIIHYSSPPGSNGDGVGIAQILGQDSEVNTIHVADISNLEQDGTPEEVWYDRDSVYPPLKVVARALSREGENGYNLWGNNCEHFATWCKVAVADSAQINFWKKTLVGGASGALLGGVLGGGVGAVVGAVKAWLSKKDRLLPVYQEFSEYASQLYFSCRRKHPLGKSFKHTSQLDEKVNFIAPKGANDRVAIFSYSGSWLFGSSKDWFITERAIVWPKKNIHINFHDVEQIYSSLGSLVVKTVEGKKTRLPSRFVSAKALAKFLTSSVAMKPLFEKDMGLSFLAIIKEMLHLTIGAVLITALIGFFFPPAVPIVAGIMLLVILIGPFIDKNESYESA